MKNVVACSGFNKKYLNVDGDRCGEICLSSFLYWIHNKINPGLVLADEESCSSLGYTKYSGTSGYGIGSFSLEFDRYSKPKS